VEPGLVLDVPDYFVPGGRGANHPWPAHALWFYRQMRRWGHVPEQPDGAARAAASFRPDLFAAALPGAVPAGLDLQPFFDGSRFDPEKAD
jgi:hypothetical protein